ncbi:MAG: hypothetical protein ACYTFW_22625, partial [Planctomycetota bacterium]
CRGLTGNEATLCVAGFWDWVWLGPYWAFATFVWVRMGSVAGLFASVSGLVGFVLGSDWLLREVFGDLQRKKRFKIGKNR